MQKMIMIGDFGKDLDDEHALVLAAGLHRTGTVNLVAVVANLKPPLERARLAKGTLQQLGLPDIPVGIGTDVNAGEKQHPYEMRVPYLADQTSLRNGSQLLVETLRAADDGSVVFVLNSGTTDAARLFREQGDLMKQKVRHVAIMGGVETDGDEIKLTDGYMVPNNSKNNTFDWDSSLYLYQSLQESNIPMIVVTRDVAYNCQTPFQLYDGMEATGNPIGACLKDRQKPALQQLFIAACLPPGAEIRGMLPIDRDRAWFINVFCAGNDPGIADDGDIWPYVGRFNLYDPINVVGAVPELCQKFFDPTPVQVGTTTHLVIGVSGTRHGIKDIEGLRSFLQDTETTALSTQH